MEKAQINSDNILLIEFDSIELNPDSSGYFSYSISPQAGLVDGTKINNQAGIYFDNNSVVMTNVTLNTVYENPEPNAAFTFAHNCQNYKLAYDFDYTGTTVSNSIFNWTFEDGYPASSNSLNPNNIEFSSVGYKLVTLHVSRNGCDAYFSDTIKVENIVNSGDSLYVCLGNEQFLIPLDTLNWWLNLGACVGKCASTSMREANETGVTVISDFKVKVAPNPATTDCNITISEITNNDPIIFTIYDSFGIKVKEEILTKYENQSSKLIEKNINLNGMNNGLYLFVFRQKSTLKTVKFIIK